MFVVSDGMANSAAVRPSPRRYCGRCLHFSVPRPPSDLLSTYMQSTILLTAPQNFNQQSFRHLSSYNNTGFMISEAIIFEGYYKVLVNLLEDRCSLLTPSGKRARRGQQMPLLPVRANDWIWAGWAYEKHDACDTYLGESVRQQGT